MPKQHVSLCDRATGSPSAREAYAEEDYEAEISSDGAVLTGVYLDMGMAQNSRARVTQVLGFGPIYQGAILAPLFEPQPSSPSLGYNPWPYGDQLQYPSEATVEHLSRVGLQPALGFCHGKR